MAIQIATSLAFTTCPIGNAISVAVTMNSFGSRYGPWTHRRDECRIASDCVSGGDNLQVDMAIASSRLESRNPARGLMTAHEGGSITGWLGNLKEGDQAAAQPLWEHYFSKLVAVARTKLRRMRRTTADEDEEDAALSAFNSFCAGAARGKFPQLADRDDHLAAAGGDHGAEGDGPGQSRRAGKSAAAAAWSKRRSCSGMAWTEADGSLAGLERIAAEGPSPEFAAMMAEECRRLLDALDDDSLRQVAAQPDGRLQQRRDRRPARLRAPNRRPAAGPDPQDLAGHRGGGLMVGDRPRRRRRESTWIRPAASTRFAKSLNAAGAAATGLESKTARESAEHDDRPALLEELLILELELRRAAGERPSLGEYRVAIPQRPTDGSRRPSPRPRAHRAASCETDDRAPSASSLAHSGSRSDDRPDHSS